MLTNAESEPGGLRPPRCVILFFVTISCIESMEIRLNALQRRGEELFRLVCIHCIQSLRQHSALHGHAELLVLETSRALCWHLLVGSRVWRRCRPEKAHSNISIPCEPTPGWQMPERWHWEWAKGVKHPEEINAGPDLHIGSHNGAFQYGQFWKMTEKNSLLTTVLRGFQQSVWSQIMYILKNDLISKGTCKM